MSEFILGFSYPFSGFRLVTRPGIRLYLIIPLLVNTLLFSLIIYFGATQISESITWLEQQWGWLAWIGWLIWPLFLILALTLFFFCFAVVANLIAAPFNGFLAEAVERFLSSQQGTGDANDGLPGPSVSEIIRSMATEVKKFLYILIRTVPLLLLFVIPVIQLAAPFIWVIFVAWMMAMEYLEYPMGNHGKDFKDVRVAIRNNRKLAMGFGFAVSLLTIIPIINFIAMPVAVAGATRLYLEKL